MNRKEIEKRVQEYGGRLPSNIDFLLDTTERELHIKMNNIGLRENMQTDSSAFEGWIFCLLAIFPNVKKVVLDWILPVKYTESNKNTEKKHYNRFLFRVVSFRKMYSWFNVNAERLNDLSLIETEINSGRLVLNYPCSEAKPIDEIEKDKKPEAHLERKLKEEWGKFNETTDHQLPVGIFRNEKKRGENLTPCGASQIDLWQLVDNNLNIYELKVKNNRSVGIISELMFYSEVMYYLKENKIHYPKDAYKANDYRHFKVLLSAFNNHEIKNILAWFTAEEFHTLIENKEIQTKILNLMNDNSFGIQYGIKRIKE